MEILKGHRQNYYTDNKNPVLASIRYVGQLGPQLRPVKTFHSLSCIYVDVVSQW